MPNSQINMSGNWGPRLQMGGNAGRGLAYSAKLLSLFSSAIVGYWPMWEPSGSVSADIGGRNHPGAYTAVTLGQTGIGDGRTAAKFTPNTSTNDVYSAGLNTDFGKQEGSIMCWAKVNAAGDWTDGAAHRVLYIGDAGTTNYVQIWKTTVNNTLAFEYRGNNVLQSINKTTSPTTFMHLAITWTKSGDAMKAYFNGVQEGSTQTGLGAWVAALTSTHATIGSFSNTPLTSWSGILAHCAALNRPATAVEIAIAATVP